MNNNIFLNTVDEDEIKTNMLNYVNRKYNKDFLEKEFILAIRGLDANNYDTLVLQDEDGIILNVYSSADGSQKEPCFDDYATAVIDRCFTDSFNQRINNSELKVYVEANMISESQITFDMVFGKSLSDLMNTYELSSMTVVVMINDSKIINHIDEVFSVYSEINNLSPNYLDFEVISSPKEDQKLNSVLENMRLNFESDWSQYPSITEKCVVLTLGLTKDEVSSLIEEV